MIYHRKDINRENLINTLFNQILNCFIESTNQVEIIDSFLSDHSILSQSNISAKKLDLIAESFTRILCKEIFSSKNQETLLQFAKKFEKMTNFIQKYSLKSLPKIEMIKDSFLQTYTSLLLSGINTLTDELLIESLLNRIIFFLKFKKYNITNTNNTFLIYLLTTLDQYICSKDVKIEEPLKSSLIKVIIKIKKYQDPSIKRLYLSIERALPKLNPYKELTTQEIIDIVNIRENSDQVFNIFIEKKPISQHTINLSMKNGSEIMKVEIFNGSFEFETRKFDCVIKKVSSKSAMSLEYGRKEESIYKKIHNVEIAE